MLGVIRRRRARKRVLLAARGVAVSYTPELSIYKYDPDDLYELRQAVDELYTLEGQPGSVLHGPAGDAECNNTYR